MITNLKLPLLRQNEHPQKYEDVEKFILVDQVDKYTIDIFQCNIMGKMKYKRNINTQVLDSVLQEYMKAFCAPPMYTLAMLRLGDTYSRHAVIYKLFRKHSRYGINM